MPFVINHFCFMSQLQNQHIGHNRNACVLIFTQSMKALSDHHINRCFDMYVIQL